MKKNKVNCETCSYRGYSSDFCKFHHKKITEFADEDCHPQSRHLYKKIGKAATIGAGAGVLATTVGLAAAPAIGLKAAIGHTMAVKITAGGGAAVPAFATGAPALKASILSSAISSPLRALSA